MDIKQVTSAPARCKNNFRRSRRARLSVVAGQGAARCLRTDGNSPAMPVFYRRGGFPISSGRLRSRIIEPPKYKEGKSTTLSDTGIT